MVISIATFGAVIFFILGTIVGSFLNVVVLRLGTGRGFGGRSGCFSCGKTLQLFELVPILSYLFLGGRCHRCKSSISIQYPLVEVLTGVVFALIFREWFSGFYIPNLFEVFSLALSLVAASLLIAIGVYDIRHKIIPQTLVLLLISNGLIIASGRLYLGVHLLSPTFLALDFLAGPIFYLFFYGLSYVSAGRWMGYGDSKLVLGLGLLLGFVSGLSGLIFAFWIGALVGIILIAVPYVLPVFGLKGSHLAVTMKTEIPFAPFLIFGAACAFFLHINVFSLFQ